MPLADESSNGKITTNLNTKYCYTDTVNKICDFRWPETSHIDMLRVLQAYYYFSVQFRENLEVACGLYPHDAKLRLLHSEECETGNLSPWPRVALVGEKLDHDEFIRRALLLNSESRSRELDEIGLQYLSASRAHDWLSRAKSISSYENDGLSRVFSAILQAPDWRGPALRAFRFFLERHIEFDSDGDTSHGSLSLHLAADDSVLPMWDAFHDLLLAAVPDLVPDGLAAACAKLPPREIRAEHLDPPLTEPPRQLNGAK